MKLLLQEPRPAALLKSSDMACVNETWVGRLASFGFCYLFLFFVKLIVKVTVRQKLQVLSLYTLTYTYITYIYM